MRIWAWQYGRAVIKTVDDIDAWDEAIEAGRYAPVALLDDYGRVIRGTHPDEYELKLRQEVINKAPHTRFWYVDGLRGTAEMPAGYDRYRAQREYEMLCESWEQWIKLMANEEEEANRGD